MNELAKMYIFWVHDGRALSGYAIDWDDYLGEIIVILRVSVTDVTILFLSFTNGTVGLFFPYV